MKIIIPTKHSSKVKPELMQYLEKSSAEVYIMQNKNSIFEAFSTIEYEDNEIVVFCHDDIEIITPFESLQRLLVDSLSEKGTGFVGCAGTRQLLSNGVWWNGVHGYCDESKYLKSLEKE